LGKKLKVAVIGSGFISNIAHIPAWRSLDKDVEVVAVADVNEGIAKETASRHGIAEYFSDYRLMLDRVNPDIVSVATPNAFHKEPAIASLEAGAHVMCEKPLGINAAQGREMYAAAKRAGKMLFVSQTGRFGPGVAAAKALYDEGYVGTPYFAETNIVRRRGVPKWGNFHIKEQNIAGPGFDIGVHALDTIIWFIGPSPVISASGKAYSEIEKQGEYLVESDIEFSDRFTPRPYLNSEFDVDDFTVAFIRLENNITISMKASWALNAPEETNVTYISGTKGGIQIFPAPVVYTTSGGYMVDIVPKVQTVDLIPFQGHHRCAAHFLRAIRGEEELIVTQEQVLNVLSIIDLIYESDKKNFEVSR